MASEFGSPVVSPNMVPPQVGRIIPLRVLGHSLVRSLAPLAHSLRSLPRSWERRDLQRNERVGNIQIQPTLQAFVEQQILRRELEVQRQLSQARAEKAAAAAEAAAEAAREAEVAGVSPDSPHGARVRRRPRLPPSSASGSASGGDSSASEEMRSPPPRASLRRSPRSQDGDLLEAAAQKTVEVTAVDE